MRKWLVVLVLLLLPLAAAKAAPPAQEGDAVWLAYVQNNVVTLADYQGQPIMATGPELSQWQSAKLFWSPDGKTLYIATREGLFATGSEGGAAVQLPGEFGLTMAIARHGGVLYNIDTANPQDLGNGLAAFPLRETNIANMTGGRGKLLTTLGEYQASTANVSLTHAAAVYARDGGLLEGGRPRLWATYGGGLFYSCCFPNPGLGLVDLGTLAGSVYDPTFITGAAAENATFSRLAAPTTEGLLRTIDLISGGERDYALEVAVGQIERVAWSLDETALYFISREAPTQPLELAPTVAYPADTRSANLVVWELNLVTGHMTQLASLGDAFGVPSMTVAGEYIFAVVVERNQALVDAFNTGLLDPNIQLGDPALDAYIPRTILWRIERNTGDLFAIDENICCVVARPR